MTIYIGADYKGRELKIAIIQYLRECNYNVVDIDMADEDYPFIAFKVGESVRNNNDTLGILVCSSGHGVSIAANKVKGIRCIRATSIKDALLGREHDGANVLALGSEITPDITLVKEIIDTFINTPFPTLERRLNRMKQIQEYEEHK